MNRTPDTFVAIKEQIPNIENTNNEALRFLNDCHSLASQIENIVSSKQDGDAVDGPPNPRMSLEAQAHNIKSLSEGLASRLRVIRDSLGN